MTPLADLLARRIAERGPMPFAEFMEAALYHPEHGYYASGRAVVGREGDYFTNVSVGPLFSRLLLRQFAEMWRALGKPERFTVVEQGANRGDFAHDLLAAAPLLEPEFAEALRYSIIEPLPKNEAAQRERLAIFGEKVEWFGDVGLIPAFVGVHFSNELIDAFPVHVIQRETPGGPWLERAVVFEDDSFAWKNQPISSDALVAATGELSENLPAPYTTEINLQARDWIREIAGKLERGWILAIDYGYPRAEFYRPERAHGTLSAYAKHQRVDDPLQTPGEIDLTAHVDFTALAEAGEQAGMRLCGFTDQHHFMTGLSKLHFADTDSMTPELQKEIRAFKTLMHPNFLGASFKVIALGKAVSDENAKLSGFAFGGDPREALL